MSITLHVNGLPHHLDVDADTPLIFALRQELGCFGAKLGCGTEQCGACVVLADGVPIYACTAQLGDLTGRQIETLEGLANDDGSLHPLQQAFVAENAAQCGFCTAGIIMRAKALLENNANPTRAEIRAALDDHLCRCGAHPRIIRAVARAAADLATPAS